MQVDEGTCAGCGQSLGPRAFWHIPRGADGRAYHLDCPVGAPPAEPPVRSPKGLRQRTLDQDNADELAERRRRKEDA